MIQFKAQRYKKMIASFYRDHPFVRENLSSLTPPRILAQRVQLRTVPWLFLFYTGFLFFFVLCTEWKFFFLFFSFFTSKYSRATVKYILREWNNTGENGGVPYREQERFVNGVNFFNRSRGCLLRFNSRRILMAAPLSTIFLHLPFHDSLRVKRVCLRPRIYTNLE